jgi:hypothetical protein
MVKRSNVKIVHLDLSRMFWVYLTEPGCLLSDGSHSILNIKTQNYLTSP